MTQKSSYNSQLATPLLNSSNIEKDLSYPELDFLYDSKETTADTLEETEISAKVVLLKNRPSELTI